MQIYQDLLDDIGMAVETGDFDRYKRHFHLPHTVQTFDTKSTIETESDLRLTFVHLCAHLEKQNVTTLRRTCISGNFDDPGTIRGCHQSWLVNRTNEITESFYCLSTLRHIDGNWRVCDGQYAEEQPSLPSKILTKMQNPPQ